MALRLTLTEELNNDMRIAARTLAEGWSIVAVRNGAVIAKSEGRRLMPALELLHELRGPELDRAEVPCVVADKVLGLAAFRLACLLGARAVYGELVSRLAVREASLRRIPVAWHRLVPAIMNIRQDGLCPMEHLAWRSGSDYEFYRALRERR
ncbi:MAG TPA: DUF1893 domain-containing protein [Firmicutes bacterium]|nr:DUF1893 domain-containing protein [Candidatus Fermentithermobacillaceae bacterium]